MSRSAIALCFAVVIGCAQNRVEKAIQAIGGDEALNQPRQFRIVYLGTKDATSIYQGRYPGAPETKREQQTLIMDVPSHRGALRTEGVQANDTPAMWRQASLGATGYSMNLKSGRGSATLAEASAGLWEQFVWSVPHLALRRLREERENLKPTPARTIDGRAFDAMLYSPANGATMTILFDRAKGFLSGYEYQVGYVLGPTRIQYLFKPYQATPGFGQFPAGYTFRIGDRLSRDMNVYDVRLSKVADDPWLKELDSSKKPISTVAQAAREATLVAPGIYYVRNVGGYNTMFVDIGDCVAVLDGTWAIPETEIPARAVAHPDLAQMVLDLVARTLPGMKVCYVVPTHHHSDHFAGIGTFAKAGATVVTSEGNLRLVRAIVGAGAKTEIVRDKVTLGSGDSRIEVYLMRGGSHAGEMLFSYFPSRRIVFEGDISDYVLNAKQFLKFVDARGLKIDRIFAVHSRDSFGLADIEDDEPAN